MKGDRVYIGFVTGERVGSIAYILDCDLSRIVPKLYRNYYDNKWGCNAGFSATVGWEKRRNKINEYIGGTEVVYLPDYQGPTVWEKFDKKAAAAEALARTPMKDREGNEIKEGDRVLYINARYGSGAQLDRGKIISIKATVQKHRDLTVTTFNVEIESDGGEKSVITKPSQSVLLESNV